jgi:cobalt-zinc-cadmium efflux system outer membrane protein
MQRHRWRMLAPVLLTSLSAAVLRAQTRTMSWDEVRDSFQRNNPNLLAGRTGIEESRANEITAGLRPNPELFAFGDQISLFTTDPYRPLSTMQYGATLTQLFERRNKRQLRVESARYATSMAATDLADLDRNLLFNLRDAFVRTLQAKSVLELAETNLTSYDRQIELNRRRFDAGDLSRADFERIELQRSQYESDLENAKVNLRTAKIALLALMNDKHPVDTFDVSGDFDFKETILLPEELHRMALESRGDIRSADTAITKGRTDNRLAWANGSTDPTLGFEYLKAQVSYGTANTIGFDIAVPLRIFDKNQGEKQRTALEITRVEHVRDGIVTGAFRDIDSAYAQVESVRALLRPYRDRYLPEAGRVRESVSFAYSRGGASLLDFLDAEKAYRDAQLNYRNLIAAYLSAANQLNLAVGREVLQ